MEWNPDILLASSSTATDETKQKPIVTITQSSSEEIRMLAPNITIEYRGPVPTFSTPLQPPVNQQTPQFSLRILPTHPSSQDFDWLEMTDTVSDTIRNTPLGALLKDPNIINNQGSNLTKTLYALKGVAQDFKDLRVKSGYTEEEVGYNLSLVYGTEFSGNVVHQFEQLLLPLSSFLSARTVMLKWMESLRPPRTNYASSRRRRRKRSSSDSEDHQIRRHRKRTKIDLASKQRLESAYRENSKPSGPMMLDLARQIGFDRDVVRVWFANRRQKQKRQRAPLGLDRGGGGGGFKEQEQMSPEIFIDDLYDTFRDNDNPEEFDDQISDFDENLNQPEETRSVSVIVATSPRSSLASPQPSPASVAPGTPAEPSLMTPLVEERVSEAETLPGTSPDEWDPVLYSLLK